MNPEDVEHELSELREDINELWERVARIERVVEIPAVGSPVWVQRGGGAPLGTPGCTRLVRGVVVGHSAEPPYEVSVRLEEDDPFDTVDWNKAGDVGHWSCNAVTLRGGRRWSI